MGCLAAAFFLFGGFFSGLFGRLLYRFFRDGFFHCLLPGGCPAGFAFASFFAGALFLASGFLLFGRGLLWGSAVIVALPAAVRSFAFFFLFGFFFVFFAAPQ